MPWERLGLKYQRGAAAKMTGSTKQKALILLGMVMVFTMIIAANLPQLEFQPGMPLPSLQHGKLAVESTKEGMFVSISATKFILVLIALVFTGTTLYSSYQLLRGADWKLISDFLRYVLIISVAIGCLVFMVVLLPGSTSFTPMEVPISTPPPLVTSPVEAVPPSILWLVGIMLLVISVAVVMWIFKPSPQARPIDLVGLEAEKARQALITGAGLKDVIIHCYIQMSLALKQEQGIERKDYMTTREFENVLESAGMPHAPIHQLTRLFDAVRYGNWQSNAVDEEKAMECLEAIMLHSRNIKGMN
jgi:hypothetical protein